ncbi:hypothetical protein [Mycolicibacterium diernhoferi]|uniref:PE family protein n=1 Tax=Mycolicibacterium diernhoferi TaxID=1801 RepID=A0A1Q4H755_9MYCO|nr:hypothetical protein [Mycolicibacterium diernhoferi]OJZ63272.1 hypothetical protein BRW64_23235 [Mycolicibacterium diernhoferi]OPE53935.1 hypothetical protein BV510_13015 [Mycolicibacterium diernhoferi]PEG55337.1 hypothetical protein CRI78_07155 [Mycolicibacterium diernhoferi]QYL21637.1 hypothetical protein K0O62_21955 [Mycolicibacterium diernhoferi]
MRFGMRPYLMAGVGIVAAGSIAIPPSVAPPGHTVRHESVALAAHVQPVNPLLQQVPEYATAQAAAALLPPEALTSTAALTETLDAASAQVSALALPGLGNAIIAAYDVIMPWVDWAVNLGIYATQWIPIVNWFTPQISIVYYSLIEPIITSAVFNTAYWVGGAISFGQGLANFFNDTVNAGIGFVNAEIDWFLGFLPPLPPFIPLAAQATMDIVGARTAMQVAAPTAVGESDPAAVDTDETESGEPAAPLPEETETAPVDEVEAEPTTPEAPVDSEPQDENASDLEPADELDQVDEDVTEDIDKDFDDEQDSAEDLADTSDDAKDDLKADAENDAEDDPKSDTDKDAETKSGTGSGSQTDTKSDSKPGPSE